MTKAEIIAAVRRAAEQLGRAPSRGELKRLTDVSHYRVLTVFRTLREAIRAAGLEPNRKGEKVATEELIRDWERVRKKLGRRPSRAEYVREGRYSAGTLVMRFGSWGKVGKKPFTTEDAEERRGEKSGDLVIGRSGDRKSRTPKATNDRGREGTQRKFSPVSFGSDKAIAFQWARSLARIPGPLEGKRRVTDAVAAMIVNTLMPGEANGNWQMAIGQNQNRFTTEDAEERRVKGAPYKEGYLVPSLAVTAPLVQDDRRRRADFTARKIFKDRPVMGAPFSRHPLTNAPVNEMGVVFLFALVAWDLGFQVEALWGRYPDGRAKREVAPGKWQDVWIEFEYESKNFVLHGHDPKKCDVIVCWRHNWKDVPDDIEIIELCSLVGA